MSQFLCFSTEFQSDLLISAEVERCVCLFGFWVFLVCFHQTVRKKELKEQKRT